MAVLFLLQYMTRKTFMVLEKTNLKNEERNGISKGFGEHD